MQDRFRPLIALLALAVSLVSSPIALGMAAHDQVLLKTLTAQNARERTEDNPDSRSQEDKALDWANHAQSDAFLAVRLDSEFPPCPISGQFSRSGELSEDYVAVPTFDLPSAILPKPPPLRWRCSHVEDPEFFARMDSPEPETVGSSLPRAPPILR